MMYPYITLNDDTEITHSEMKGARIRMKTTRRSTICRLLSWTAALVLVLGSTASTFAATQEGDGGAAFAGPSVNTFAAGMPLSEIYFDADKINYAASEVSITSDPNSALSIRNSKQITIKDSALKDDTADNNSTGSFKATYKDAAILPDGTLKDVVLDVDIVRVMTATTGSEYISMPATTIIFNNPSNLEGIDFAVSTNNEATGIPNSFFGIGVEQKVTISVDGAGDFVVPFYGFNQNRNNANSYVALRTVHGNDGYHMAVETAIVPDTNVFYPSNNKNYITISEGNFIHRGGSLDFYDPPNQKGTETSIVSDTDGYQAGFAAVGSSGFKTTINAACSENQGKSFPNNQFISLGDLIHRIWSGSGPHGSIATDKKGDTTGASMPGGSFTGDVPSGMPASNTAEQQLMRYVIPDAKSGVTYTMTPDKGYTLEKIVVDGNEYTVPDIPEATVKIASSDGNGTLKYLGGGKFTYSFDQANTQDHEIYVTWKKATADINVIKLWNDDSKAAAANVRLVSDAGFDESKAVPQKSGEVYTWVKMPIYKYDSNGDATDAITYTLSEVSDPVSGDYMAAVWAGADKEGGTADGGFTLTDPSKENMSREPDDQYSATVINTLSKTVEISKIWDDQNNKYKIRPSDVAAMFKLYNAADDSEIINVIPTATADGANKHKIKWSGLPAFDVNGEAITYYAIEIAPVGYTPNPSGSTIKEGGNITNKLTVKLPTGKDTTSTNSKGVPQTGTPEFAAGTGEIPAKGAYILIDSEGNPVESITIPGEGTYTIDKDTGVVTFTPDPNFVGTGTGVTVQVTDELGITATAKYTPTVLDDEKITVIKRTIKYTYLTADGEPAHDDLVQTLRVVQKGHYDPDDPAADENGMVWDDKWEYPDGKTFPAVNNPEISGWKTDDAVGEYTISGPDDVPPEVHVVYQKIIEPAPVPEDEGVDTGDANTLIPWITLAALVAVIIAAIIARRSNAE